ncbi:MAG: extracellular solute-binding protein, partial [Bacteroidota bacterium]
MKATPFVSILFLLFTLSCSGGEEVNLYSARHYETDLELYDLFTEETGIEINLIEGGSDELIERIRNEGVNSPADIFITVDAGRIWRAEEADILQSATSELLEEEIPASLRDPDGKWYGISQRVRGIIYHKERVDPEEIGGYLDLSDEKWEGRICV